MAEIDESMLDRVAKFLFEMPSRVGWTPREARGQASELLKLMRDPTDTMKRAAGTVSVAAPGDDGFDIHQDIEAGTAEDVWQAMIDKAREEG